MTPEDYVEHFRARILQDALNEATSSYWIRRAEQFEGARPRLGEYYGTQSVDQLRTKWLELTEIATACRNAATLARWQTEPTAEVLEAIREAEAA